MRGKYQDALLVSIKPQYAKKIFKGEKTVELRKCAPKKVEKGSQLLIYVTSPVKELWGICKIDGIIKDNPKSLWSRIGDKSGISEYEFYEYYGESNDAYAIEITNVKNFYDKSLNLKKLQEIIPGFTPPQTYKYIEKDILLESILFEISL